MKTKIAIVGLGGVGGYYGGLFAERYFKNSDIEIYFYVRGEHLRAIQRDGIRVITDENEKIGLPTLASDDANEIGLMDYIIIATKSYDLELVIQDILPMIGPETILLPLLNGVDNTTRIEKLLPNNQVWSGCSYIVARRTEPGVIKTSGKLHLLNFGYKNQLNDRLLTFEKILTDAGIDAKLCEDIHNEIWKKFCFISVTASLTCYFNVGFAELLDIPVYKEMFVNLIEELVQVARAEGANQDLTMIDKAFHRIGSIPRGQTTSMHSDMQAGRKMELYTLTGVVVDLAHKHGISVPNYEKVYEALCKYI
jgi:2-dehydropantoate 2-reductase